MMCLLAAAVLLTLVKAQEDIYFADSLSPERRNTTRALTMEPVLRGTARSIEHPRANESDPLERRVFIGKGQFVTDTDWKNKYDFVVLIRFWNCEKGWHSICTGWIKDDIVVTAAHCAKKCSKATDFKEVKTATESYEVTQLIRNDKWDGNGGHGHDIMMLRLNKKYENRVKFLLSSDRLQDSAKVNLLGFGQTETGDSGKPSITDSPLDVVSCPWCFYSNNVQCLSSGSHSDLTSCGGDSGGPWFLTDDHGQIIIVAANSFGYQRFLFTCNPFYDKEKACGTHSKETGISPVSEDRDFIDTYAPRYFEWTHDKCVTSKIESVKSEESCQSKCQNSGFTKYCYTGYEWYRFSGTCLCGKGICRNYPLEGGGRTVTCWAR
jgi:hypothetical protein